MKTIEMPADVRVLGPVSDAQTEILSPDALAFFASLHREFNPRRLELLRQRKLRQEALDRGEMPRFLTETNSVREDGWRVSPVPKDLQDRRVEITGPVDRKMVINALNSGADCFMADFEDSNAPTWGNTVEGKINVMDAVRRTVDFVDPASGKEYRLADETATLIVRPRGLHLTERHIHVDGRPIPASLFDFGLYFFHNAHALIRRGTGPFFYLPKLESYREARLWNEVFLAAEETLGIPRGTIKATVL